MPSREMLDDPGVFVVVAQVRGRRKTRIQPCTQARERSEVALGDDRNTRLQEKRGRDPDSLLIAPFCNETTTVRNDLASTRCAHVGEHCEFSPLVSSEQQHCFSTRHHLGGQISAMFVHHLRASREHVEAVAAVNVWHRSRRAEAMLLWAERQGP